MKVIVTGGRDFVDYQLFARHMNRLRYQLPIDLVIHGAYRGADELADQWARLNNIPCLRVPALWKQHGKHAGPMRNEEMLRFGAEAVIAFPGGAGTEDMKRKARIRELLVIEPCEQPET